jgi:DNA-binding transcriptional ArsR family regulator
MGKRGRPSLVELDSPPFRILLLILSGVTTPKGLAEELGVAPSTVVFHLNRLKRAGILRRAEKIGKFQPYEVDWTCLARAFLNMVSPELISQKEGAPSIQELAENRYVKMLVEAGLHELSMTSSEVVKLMKINMKGFFTEFNRALAKAKLSLEGISDDGEGKKFMKFMSFMQENLKRRWQPGELEWIKAMAKLGLTDKSALL